MSKNQIHKSLIAELVKTHPSPKEVFLKLLSEYPQERETIENIAKALKVNLQ